MMTKNRLVSFLAIVFSCLWFVAGLLTQQWLQKRSLEEGSSKRHFSKNKVLHKKTLGSIKDVLKRHSVDSVVSGDSAPYTVRSSHIPRNRRGFSRGKAKFALVISIDGVSYDAMRKYGVSLPTFKSLVQKGFFRPSQTVFPSVTWNAHAAIITGQYPRHHGILGNRWLEHFRSLIYPFQSDITEPKRIFRTPSVYDLVAKRGWKTAVLNWPSTQRARHITYNLPEIMYSSSLTYRYLSKPLKRLIRRSFRSEYDREHRRDHAFFRHFLGRLMESEKIETDMFVRDLAVSLIQNAERRHSHRPRVMFVHFLTPDSWFHKYGVSPWLVRWSLEQMDRLVGDVVRAYKKAGIWSQTATFITSDHGFSDAKYTFGMRQLLIQRKFCRFLSMVPRNRRRENVMAFLNGHAAYLYVKPAVQKQVLPRLIRLLHENRWKRCIKGVYTPKEYRKFGLPIPDLGRHVSKLYGQDGRHSGAPSLVALSRPDCVFIRYHRRGSVMQKVEKSWRRFGVHGYLPNKRAFWTFLLGHGAGIRRRGMFSKKSYIVDIAPTILHLMGVKWPRRWPGFGTKRRFRLDGRVLRDVLKQE